MSEYGLPARNATQDANAGRVNPQSTKYQARTTATVVKNDADSQSGLMALGSSLGEALASKVHTEVENFNEKRATAAVMRQGTDYAINQTDQLSKRTGWTKAVFGENVEYRAAQQRAVENSTNAKYLEQAASIDESAGSSPEEYQKKLTDDLDGLLEPYKGDKETKQLVTQTYMLNARKLAAKQYDSHFAYNQQQQKETTYNAVLQSFDQFSIESGLVTDDTERTNLSNNMASTFSVDSPYRPTGMAGEAWSTTVNEALVTSLKGGNISAWQEAQKAGWDKTLTPKQRVAIDTAISAYDTKFVQNVQLALEDGELAASEAPNTANAMTIYADLRANLDKYEQRLSGTAKGKLALTKAKNSVNSIMQKAYDTALENEAAEKEGAKITAALRITDPIEQAAALTSLELSGVTSSDLKDNMDVTIIEDVQRLTGEEELTADEALHKVFQDPAIAQKISQRYSNSNVDSPFLKRAMETFINGFANTADENGQISETGGTAMKSIAQFSKDKAKFKGTVGPDNYDRYLIIQRGLSVGSTVEQIAGQVDAYTQGKGNLDAYAIDWKLNKDESKQDRINKLYKNFTGDYPTSSSLAYAQREFQRGLYVNQGDLDGAEEYLKTSLQDASITYRGRSIQGGKDLNSVTDYQFEQLLDGAQQKVGDSSLMTFILEAGGMKVSKMGDTPYKLEDNMNIYVVDGLDGFFINSPEMQQPIRVGTDLMEQWGQVLSQRKNILSLEEQAKKETFNNWLKTTESQYDTGMFGGF